MVDERVGFIAAVKQEPRGNFTRLCERFGITRETGYKWVERYHREGPEGLRDRKPVPGSCPHRTPDAVESRVVELRKQWPDYGPKKLRAMLLEKAPELAVPAASTIGDILDRNGLIRPRRVRLRVPPSSSPLAHAQQPNDVWCVDFNASKSNVTEQQRAFDRFRHEYNDLRPHEALSQTPPARHYEPSLRPMTEPRAPQYDPDMTLRWVGRGGDIAFKGTRLYASNLLAHQPVALRQTDADEWELFYGPLQLGYVLVRNGKPRIEPLR